MSAALVSKEPLEPPAWLWPLLVLVLVAPLSAAFFYQGPVLGLFLGLVFAAIIVIYAVDADSASVVLDGNGTEKILVFGLETFNQQTVSELERHWPQKHPLLLEVPLQMSIAQLWAGDRAQAEQQAQQRLQTNLKLLRAQHPAAVEGEIADQDLYLAASDALSTNHISELTLVHAHPLKYSQRRAWDKLQHTLPLAVEEIDLQVEPLGSAASLHV